MSRHTDGYAGAIPTDTLFEVSKACAANHQGAGEPRRCESARATVQAVVCPCVASEDDIMEKVAEELQRLMIQTTGARDTLSHEDACNDHDSARRALEAALDAALADTFPASDPVSVASPASLTPCRTPRAALGGRMTAKSSRRLR